MSYSVGPRTLVFLGKIRIVISHKNKTTCANTYTRLDHNAIFKATPKQKIAIGELGGVVILKTFLNIWQWCLKVQRLRIFKN